MKKCQEQQCDKPVKARNLCSPHYNRLYWKELASPATLQNRQESYAKTREAKLQPDWVPRNLRTKRTPEFIAAQKAAQSKKRRRTRREQLNIIKLASGCVDCGYADDPIALDFDHIDGKTFTISKALGRGRPFEDILLEIQRCEVRCANCHRIKTFNERNPLS